MLLLSLFLCALSSHVLSNSDERDEVVQETLKLMLDYNRIPAEMGPHPLKSVSRQTSSYMDSLYRSFLEEDGSDDGNVVRAIEPSVGKVDGQEVLIFDISHIGSEEKLMRGELHLHLRGKGSSRKRARSLSARALCTNEYCTEAQYLYRLSSSSDDVIWDTTKAVVESHALGAKQLIVRISRKDVKMRSYSEMVRKSAPFLLVFSKGKNVLDGERVRREVEGARRRRREANGYYTYNADHLMEPKSLSEGGERPAKKNKGGKIRAHRNKKKSKKDDIWAGFGEESDDESDESEEEGADTQTSNDVRVVLLGDKNKACSLFPMDVDLRTLGWSGVVLAPSVFEAGRCQGQCNYPLPMSSTSNHAVLQSLLLPSSSPICCAPDDMESLTVLYRDQFGHTTIKNFPRMIVKSCACL